MSVQHQLNVLWKELKPILEKGQEGTFELGQIKLLDDIVHDYEKLDPVSQSFRYPTDKKGKINLANKMYLNLEKIKEVCKSSLEFLEGIDIWIDVSFDRKYELFVLNE
jgi:hypothetical protein